MSKCDCKKNQTPNDVFDYLKALPDQERTSAKNSVGTGMFLVPAPEIGILEEKVVLVPDLSFVECSKRGENCVAFKWIPNGYKSESEIKNAIMACSDHWCGPNQDWCPGLCFCGSGNYCR